MGIKKTRRATERRCKRIKKSKKAEGDGGDRRDGET
jgi:hypothetical protein